MCSRTHFLNPHTYAHIAARMIQNLGFTQKRANTGIQLLEHTRSFASMTAHLQREKTHQKYTNTSKQILSGVLLTNTTSSQNDTTHTHTHTHTHTRRCIFEQANTKKSYQSYR